MTSALTLLQSDPITTATSYLGILVAALAIGAGLVLWVAGIAVLKPILALIAAGVGGSIGAAYAPSLFGSTLGSIDTGLVGLGVGAVIGLAAAIALFRFAMGLAAAVVVGIAGFAISSTVVGFDALGTATGAPLPAAAAPAEPATAPVRSLSPETRDAGAEAQAAIGQFARSFAKDVRDGLANVRASFEQLPEGSRMRIGLATIGGAAAGLLFGVLMPRRVGSLITSLLGSIVWLLGAQFVWKEFGLPLSDRLPLPAPVLLGTWGVLTVVGIGLQARFRGTTPKT